jgi:predicted Zn-dependent protease
MLKIRRILTFIILAVFISLNFTCITTNESGRTSLILTSESQEKQMGEEYYEEVLKESKLSKNKKWVSLVNRVGSRIASKTGKDYDWEYNVIQSKEINAWALPGGKIAFYEGIMKIFDNEAEMAAVMGHEIGHVVLRHGGERMSQGLIVNILGSVLDSLAPDDQYKELYLGAFAGVTTLGVILPYSRLHEYEADNYGMLIMAKAGYDPRNAVKFWEKMSKLSEGGKPPEFLSTHPSDENRIKKMEELLPKAMEEYKKAEKRYSSGDKVN